jgi:hypothetical protein
MLIESFQLFQSIVDHNNLSENYNSYSESDIESTIECNYSDTFASQKECLNRELTFPNGAYADFMNLVGIIH